MTKSDQGQWDCRHFDTTAYREQIMKERTERHATFFSVVFLQVYRVHGIPEEDTKLECAAATCSSGKIRLFSIQELMMCWATKKRPSSELFSWQAHVGAVYSLLFLPSERVLVSGGDDGWLRGWQLTDVHVDRNVQSSQNVPSHAPQLLWETKIVRVDTLLGGTGLTPGINCAAANPQSQVVYIGASDGGVHTFDASSGGALMHSLPGHVAGVLSIDMEPSSCSLATGSEDGTVRVWDCRIRGVAECVSVLNPWDGVELPLQNPALYLQSVKSPYVSVVRFASDGAWLLVGTGNSALTLWSVTLKALAKQQALPFVPQAVSMITGGEILVAGSASQLLRYRFSSLSDEAPSKHALASASVYGMDVHPITGTTLLCGAGGVIELLSSYGTRIGAIFPTGFDD
ncbi:hypothetical protein CEUSTIGMA_g7974.t1 [Chlamydomonas eustigma]|uniref:Uncharacterized protein n=1 Tax=Chlamydomonas eustigma TaxID=1157962 RepID=A0A250XBV8_9CHLO|nr:hypothetical protein CEUSTIGMA_g7974.t1 [Chlamydomonas eustigma]|eukprot:GAX80536.1 hypothetical protein CEUSTIGMA_g7974.t1 [Chlamydomonas eustigma]